MSLATIGQKLKSAREAQGLSLVQVHERTKIPMDHLNAVEQGDTDELPEPVFIFGFIKRYAECIGLDGQVLADEYRKHVDELSGNGRKNHNAATPYYASSDYLSKSKPRLSTPTYKLWFFNALIIVGVVGTITWFINTTQNNIANQVDPTIASLRGATRQYAPTAPLPNQPNQANSQPSQPQPQETSEKISLSATRHVWVEVKRLSSGESIFTGFLEQGDRRDFEDSQGLIVRAGDGGGLSVDNRGKMEPFGLNGKIVERQFILQSAQQATPVATTTAATPVAVTPRPAPVVRRRPQPNPEASRPRPVVHRRYEGGVREAPTRYSEGRLDSD